MKNSTNQKFARNTDLYNNEIIHSTSHDAAYFSIIPIDITHKL